MYYLFPVIGLLFANCTFDYGESGEGEKNRPDIVMENIEYVRVRKGDPLARFQAEHAERWEERQTMELRFFSFEQMEDSGKTINAEGKAGAAVVQLGSGDISLSNGVRISVESEDVIITTAGLEWKDKEKVLSGGEFDEVEIERSDGTKFLGRGFSADARNRIWTFSGEVWGSYVEKEDEDKEKTETVTEDETIKEWTWERPSYPSQRHPDEFSEEEYQEEEYLTEESPMEDQAVPATEKLPEPKPAAPEPKPAAPEPKPAAPEPKPAAPEPKPVAPEPKPAAPEPKPIVPEPKPVVPQQPQILPPEPLPPFVEDK